ncbi:MAG: META domain-containing protein [Methanomicrobiales archaeon]|nr:META domain-containing protein [Methanomicrobiales archaeon]
MRLRQTVSLGFLCLVSIFLLITITGCSGQTQTDLNGTHWILVSYSNGGSLEPVASGTGITLNFGPDRVSGSGGCNQYGAAYTMQGSSGITFSDIISTLMYCQGPAGEQEEKYFTILRSVTRYALGPGRLTFFSTAGDVLLVFEEKSVPAPVPLGGTQWELVGFHEGAGVSSPVNGTSITATFGDDGNLSGSAGCNAYFAAYSTNNSALSLGGIGTTKKYCTSPEGIMMQESAYVNSLAKVRGYSIGERGLVLIDGNGSVILSFRASGAS